jgi:hypothetical protein
VIVLLAILSSGAFKLVDLENILTLPTNDHTASEDWYRQNDCDNGLSTILEGRRTVFSQDG